MVAIVLGLAVRLVIGELWYWLGRIGCSGVGNVITSHTAAKRKCGQTV